MKANNQESQAALYQQYESMMSNFGEVFENVDSPRQTSDKQVDLRLDDSGKANDIKTDLK